MKNLALFILATGFLSMNAFAADPIRCECWLFQGERMYYNFGAVTIESRANEKYKTKEDAKREVIQYKMDAAASCRDSFHEKLVIAVNCNFASPPQILEDLYYRRNHASPDDLSRPHGCIDWERICDQYGRCLCPRGFY